MKIKEATPAVATIKRNGSPPTLLKTENITPSYEMNTSEGLQGLTDTKKLREQYENRAKPTSKTSNLAVGSENHRYISNRLSYKTSSQLPTLPTIISGAVEATE